MKTLNIIHLFPKLLSLYGEYGNLAVLKLTLQSRGYTVNIHPYEMGEPDLSQADLVYMGSGTEDNLLEAVRRLMPHKEAIRESIEKGTHWLVTGNAPAILGAAIETGVQTEALGLFPYTTKLNLTGRYLGDVLAKDKAGNTYVGFINTANAYTGMENPWLELQLNPKLGNDKASPSEGMTHRNLTATQLIGPILAKNPHLLYDLCTRLTGEEFAPEPQSNLCKAYEICLAQLQNRLNAQS